MKVKRDGNIYEVIDESDTDYAVEVEIEYQEGLKKEKLWWSKKSCEIVEE